MSEDFSPTACRLSLAEVERRLASDHDFARAVGADFISTGGQELALLRSLGLADGQFVIDVGCGAGRLAYQMAENPRWAYLGCDVSAGLLQLARELTPRPDFRFECTDGATIPCANLQADIVCFFSVFEHLHYEDIFKYFHEAGAKLTPGGLLVMTFFEFRVDSHWRSFLAGVDAPDEPDHLNQFLDRDGITAWASHSGFDILHTVPGDAGRSMMVLRKRRQHLTADDYLVSAAGSNAAPAGEGFPLRIANTSVRVPVGTGENAFVQGLVLRGEGARSYLFRAIGPALKNHGITHPLATPGLAVLDARGGPVASGRGWDPSLARIFALAGAFDLPDGSADTAFVATLSAGSYTLTVTGGDSGVVLVETYELP